MWLRRKPRQAHLGSSMVKTLLAPVLRLPTAASLLHNQCNSVQTTDANLPAAEPSPVPAEATRLGQLSREQWRSGAAAWLGWL